MILNTTKYSVLDKEEKIKTLSYPHCINNPYTISTLFFPNPKVQYNIIIFRLYDCRYTTPNLWYLLSKRQEILTLYPFFFGSSKIYMKITGPPSFQSRVDQHMTLLHLGTEDKIVPPKSTLKSTMSDQTHHGRDPVVLGLREMIYSWKNVYLLDLVPDNYVGTRTDVERLLRENRFQK